MQLSLQAGQGLCHAQLRERLLAKAGLASRTAPAHRRSMADLAHTEWSHRFERLMRHRLIMGALRYGPLHRPGKPAYDRVAGARKRLAQYAATGNLECLVDVANMALLEFEEGRHPRRHWAPHHEDHCCE